MFTHVAYFLNVYLILYINGASGKEPGNALKRRKALKKDGGAQANRPFFDRHRSDAYISQTEYSHRQRDKRKKMRGAKKMSLSLRHVSLKSTQTMKKYALNPTQLHLLKMFSFAKSEQSLHEIQKALSSYFALRVEEDMDKLWDDGSWNQEKNEEVLHEHLRTA
jgi:hypothetical protein